MATQTTNLNLTKPGTTDPVDISVINNNMDKLDAQFTTGSFTPHIYDNNTYLGSLGSQTYIKVGKMYFFQIYKTITETYNISTMLQIRNFPCKYIFGGSVYYSGITGQFGDKTIQPSDSYAALIRPNFTGSIGGNGVFCAFLVGMGAYS